MTEIEQKVISTYKKNLDFLKKHDEKLFDRIEQLSLLMETEEFPTRYQLEYIQEDQEFDVFDIVSNRYLYNRAPLKYIHNAVEETKFDKSSSIDILDQTIYNNKLPAQVSDELTLQHKTLRIVVNDIFEYVKVFRSSTQYKNKQFKYIDKFIFVGTMLGTHILPIHQKINSQMYFICEHNLELFRLSLFVTDYAQLAKESELIFSIMDEEVDFMQKMGDYFHFTIRSNYMIKYYCSNYNIHNYFDKILEVASMKNPFAFSYKRIQLGFLEPAFRNTTAFPVVDLKHEHTLFKNKPLLFLAAGPSLEKNIDWIKENGSKFTIVTIGAALKTLFKNQIKPAVIFSADGDEIILKQFPDNIIEFIDNSVLLLSSITNKVVTDKLNHNNIIIFEAMGEIKENSVQFNGYSVGEVTLSVLSVLGANQIYLLGTDLALDQDTGATHSSDHAKVKNFNMSNEILEYNSFMKDGHYCMGDSTTIVKGNFKDKVVTTLTMQKSIPSYNKSINIILSKEPDTKIYNLSDGAYFENTIPTKIDTLNIQNSDTLTPNEILENLKKYSEEGLTKKEQRDLKKSINQVDILVSSLNNIKDIKVRTYDQLSNQRGHIINFIKNGLLKYQRYYLDRLFIYYILTIEPYIGYQFNEEIENEVNLTKKVKKIWIKQLLKLCDDYKTLVYSYIDKENYTLKEEDKKEIEILNTSSDKKQELLDLLKSWYEVDSQNLYILEQFGIFLQKEGEYQNALHIYNQYIDISKDNCLVYLYAAQCFYSLQEHDQAILYLQKTLHLSRDNFEANNLMAKILIMQQSYKDSIPYLKTAIKKDSSNYEVFNDLGISYVNLNIKDEAIESFKKSILLNSEYIEAYINLGLLYIHYAQIEKAQETLNKALLIDPTISDIYKLLSDIQKHDTLDKSLIDNLEHLISTSKNFKDKINLNFALSKIYDDLKDYDKSFSYLEKANFIQEQNINYSIEQHKSIFKNIKDKFSSYDKDISTYNVNSQKNMVFIVGMPRSGTSLIEQILSSHSNVYGAGELNFLGSCVKEIVTDNNRSLAEEDFSQINNGYFEKIKQFDITQEYITDKLPNNFMYIGFILYAFPNAKIIHLNRDPIAVCWSIYKNYFSTAGTGYSCSIENIVEFYKLYLDIMNFWEQKFPNKIYNINYEKLTQNQEVETKKILEFCDLEWEDNCMEFYNNKKIVRTLSTNQVRKKIYKNSSKAWESYSKNIQPLLDKLKKENII